METTTIAGVKVSRIGLGTWAIGGLDWGTVPDDVAVATCLGALERGINLIDTAPIYGHGRSEEIVGRAIRAHGRREDFFIAPKPASNGTTAASTQIRPRRSCKQNSKPACAAWTPTLSTSTKCTGRIRARPSPKPPRCWPVPAPRQGARPRREQLPRRPDGGVSPRGSSRLEPAALQPLRAPDRQRLRHRAAILPRSELVRGQRHRRAHL